MKMIATVNYGFERLITGGKSHAAAYKADRRLVTLIDINFSVKKHNINGPRIENKKGLLLCG